MNFGEAIQQVYDITKRPDKDAETQRAINSAINQYSLAATFYHDLVESTYTLNSTEYAQSITISTTFTRFRKVAYLRPTGAKFILDKIDPSKAITPNGCERTNVWYRAGDRLVLRFQNLWQTLEYGYFQYPLVLSGNSDTHWMLDITPNMITDFAISRIFDSVGEQTEAKRYKAMADEAFIIAKNDLATGDTW